MNTKCCAFILQYISCSPSSSRTSSNRASFHSLSHVILSPIGIRGKEVGRRRSTLHFGRAKCPSNRNFEVQSAARGPKFAPGTTTLLVQISEPVRDLRSWTQQWLSDYIFSARAALTVPVSLRVNDKEQCEILFYASDSTVRGILLVNVAAEGEKSITSKLQITSSSRFVNPSGTYTSTLPGERRIIRYLYSAIAERFESARVLYKSKNIRLRKYFDSHESLSAHATVLVCEVRNVSRTQLVSSLHDWAFEIQFSATGLFFDEAALPPISLSSFRNGVKVHSCQGPDAEVIAHVRTKGTNVDRTSDTGPRRVPVRPNQAIVVVSATYPNEKSTRVLLKRYFLNAPAGSIDAYRCGGEDV
ncbi:hypothetical protein FGB62_11g112 [Gracilaria domingensis]|nr:hypothetical protein FGB62_11g112 [Gracilaria domingensis]